MEFDLLSGRAAGELVGTAVTLTGPLSTTGGVNLVVGFRPELWAEVAPADAPADAVGWGSDLVGPDGFTMPAT